jgi:hypothetical protein
MTQTTDSSTCRGVPKRALADEALGLLPVSDEALDCLPRGEPNAVLRALPCRAARSSVTRLSSCASGFSDVT